MEIKNKKEKIKDLKGLSVLVASNICTKDFYTTCSSDILKGYRSPYDATAVKRLKKSGAAIAGKAEIAEFNIGVLKEGGFSTAVLHSDAGGELRAAANKSGVIGYKPTYGAVSRYGLISYASSLDQIGVIAKTVLDAAALGSKIIGRDPLDATSVKFSLDLKAVTDFSIKRKNIAVLSWNEENVNKNVSAFYNLGAGLADISLPHLQHAGDAHYIISSAEASSNLARFDGVRFGYSAKEAGDFESLYVKSRTGGFGENVKKRMTEGAFFLGADNYETYYKKAKIAQSLIIEDFENAFKTCDVIIAPFFDIGLSNKHVPVTLAVNLAGLPAVAVNGIQIIGKKFDDATVLAYAHALEREVKA